MSDDFSLPRDISIGELSAQVVSVSHRQSFSIYHLYAARHAAAQAAELEVQPQRKGLDVLHRSYVMAAVVESASFLEASINELFGNAADGVRHSMTGLPDHEVRALAAVWHISGSGLQGRVLDKYDSALAVRGQPAFVRGEDPYQSAKLLIELRNYLVHYKVHSTSLDEEHELSAKLKNRFDSNTRREDPNHPWFPDQALGAGCARWAWESATALTSQFEAVMGVALAYSTQPEDFWPDGSGGLL